MKSLFDQVSNKCSKFITNTYSTSFSLGIRMLHKDLHEPIYNIYGFVRLADEIVDTFHEFDKEILLDDFINSTFKAIQHKVSLNPILNSFQDVVNQYNIDHELIHSFISSMKKDLYTKEYDTNGIKDYILGSAEVVGLMCLTVFLNGDKEQYNKLKPYAMSLGSAFQKINFLRDISTDYKELGRTYFPDVNIDTFNKNDKSIIENDIEKDFIKGLEGIKLLPKSSKGGVYLSYLYFYSLLNKIKKIEAEDLLEKRFRVSNYYKVFLLIKSKISVAFNRI